MENNERVFFTLLQAGLWERGVQLLPFEPLNFDVLYQIADGQSVVGLLAAGLEHVQDRRITKPEAVPFLKKVFSQETRNTSMNAFIESLVGRMRDVGIYSLLVKGQGVAQCYERPEWRAAGDVDLLLDEDNYEKAKVFLAPLAATVNKEYEDRAHLAMTIDSWVVELHGSLRNNRLGRVNALIDEAQEDAFKHGHVRIWRNGETDIFLPAVDNDIIFIFTHILQHLFAGGIGLRQICDWCRLLWTYKDEIDQNLLKFRLKRARIQSEWDVFASLAVNYLGIPMEAMPFYRKSRALDRKARRLMEHILRTGNFGQNRDLSYMQKYPFLIRKAISFWRVTQDAFHRLMVFPLDSIEFYFRYVISGSKSAIEEIG